MKDVFARSLALHAELKGKMSAELKAPLENQEDLSLMYSPGVAQPCREIAANPESVYDYTWKGNTVAVVTNGTAILGLGDLGPEAALPVMEGKCALFKRFGGVNAVPVLVNSKDPEEIIRIVKAISPTYGGINLEDIKAPECITIEQTLIRECNIPIFHDDQHGTAIVTTAAVINALKLVKKKSRGLQCGHFRRRCCRFIHHPYAKAYRHRKLLWIQQQRHPQPQRSGFLYQSSLS